MPLLALLALLASSNVSFADVSPGDVITAANAQQARGLAPYTIENSPELEMKIVPTEDYAPHPKYVEATVKYACQATLGPKGDLLNYTAGQPFAYSEWAKSATSHKCDLTPDDPQIGAKLAWNFNFRWQARGTHMPHTGQSYWRGKEDEDEDRTNKSDSTPAVPPTGVLEPPPSEVRAFEATGDSSGWAAPEAVPGAAGWGRRWGARSG